MAKKKASKRATKKKASKVAAAPTQAPKRGSDDARRAKEVLGLRNVMTKAADQLRGLGCTVDFSVTES